MPNEQIVRNRKYIDLIHAKKFNALQRKSIKEAVELGLNDTQLLQIAKTEYRHEHITQFAHFLKNHTYSENKKLYDFFRDELIDVNILRQINLALDDGLKEADILLFAVPEKFVPEQMNVIRQFLKKSNYTEEYIQCILDDQLSIEAMNILSKACDMELPFEEIRNFDQYDDMFPSMVQAVLDGILPYEVMMILDVSSDRDYFEGLCKGISLGLDDDEIMCCSENVKHLDFNVQLMAEVHDQDFIIRVNSISELERRKLIEALKDEKRYLEYLISVYEDIHNWNQSPSDLILEELESFDIVKYLRETDYARTFVSSNLSDKEKFAKTSLKLLLFDDIDEKYKIDKYEPHSIEVNRAVSQMLENKIESVYGYKESMTYILSNLSDLSTLLQNRIGDIQRNGSYTSFMAIENIEVVLKEYTDYFDLEKICVYYEDKISDISAKELKRMESKSRRIEMTEQGEPKAHHNHQKLKDGKRKGRDI